MNTPNKRARSMRMHPGLAKAFWVDVVNTTYLINKGPTVPFDFKLLEG